MAIKVSLRQKSILNGRKSLYLDFYPSIVNPKTGKQTRREFLKMYVLDKPKAVSDKKHNKEVLQIAEAIRKKRENELNKPEIYTRHELEQLELVKKGKINFVDYFYEMVRTRKGSNYNNWLSAYYYLKEYKSYVEFNQLSIRLFEDFKTHLLSVNTRKSKTKKLAVNSAVSYFNKVKACLKQAYKEGHLQNDLNAQIKAIKEEEVKKEFFSLDELNLLIKTPCENELYKQMAMFSALTGLRFSDIKKLKWSEVRKDGNTYALHFKQKKTKGQEVQPISEQAYNLLGDKGEDNVFIFQTVKYSAYNNKHLKQWVKDTGIKRDITFHCFRHTYATLQLLSGTDLYTVSKMLGHKNIKTTQIYAKVVDELKQQTVDKIQLDIK